MRVALLAGWLVASTAQAKVIEFYGGDADGRNGLMSEMNGTVTGGAWTFDDFDHEGGPITAMWGNFFTKYPSVQSAYYEIRSGISKGDGGTLHASGKLTNVTFLPTGRLYFGDVERFIKGNTDIPYLPAGRYYLAIQPRTTLQVRAYVVTTSGQNLGPLGDPNPFPTGTPRKNDNSWFHSEHFGANFEPASWELGPGVWDFSYGVEVPEPGGMGMLILAALPSLRRR